MKNIALGSMDTVMNYVQDSSHSKEIKRASFEAALDGIRSGVMTYKNDKILPMIQDEMAKRLQKFKGMSADEEGKLLQITEEQRRILMDNDRKLKNEFLSTPPAINHGGVKMHDKYKSFLTMTASVAK